MAHRSLTPTLLKLRLNAILIHPVCCWHKNHFLTGVSILWASLVLVFRLKPLLSIKQMYQMGLPLKIVVSCFVSALFHLLSKWLFITDPWSPLKQMYLLAFALDLVFDFLLQVCYLALCCSLFMLGFICKNSPLGFLHNPIMAVVGFS